MKTLILSLLVSLALVGTANAAESGYDCELGHVAADGVIGTEDASYRVLAAWLSCDAMTTHDECKGALHNGDATTDAVKLFMLGATSATTPVDLSKFNSGKGIKFGSGIYANLLTNATLITVCYAPN